MKNLDQIRARNALKSAVEVRKEEGEGNALSGYPSLIINNGLMPTLAFSMEKEGQHLRIADAIAAHLVHMDGNDVIQLEQPKAQSLLRKLGESDAATLQLCSSEALAFLSFLKRFAK
jgi:CRISPR type III-B/RAMP module-associated protein Cmr5